MGPTRNHFMSSFKFEDTKLLRSHSEDIQSIASSSQHAQMGARQLLSHCLLLKPLTFEFMQKLNTLYLVRFWKVRIPLHNSESDSQRGRWKPDKISRKKSFDSKHIIIEVDAFSEFEFESVLRELF